jgi:hypothetical protein
MRSVVVVLPASTWAKMPILRYLERSFMPNVCGGLAAEGVGRAATNAFVHSFVLILILDLFLGIWLNNVHDFFRPEGPRRLL